MNNTKTSKVPSGVVHKLTPELRERLEKDDVAHGKWESLTPLARNEWICWITAPKLKETRDNHLKRCLSELKEGKRRPCCWPGCSHREKNNS